VASIKPSPPPEGGGFTVRCSGGPGSKDPTLFTCENMSLSNLVTRAYELNHYQLSAPDWLAQQRFEISARVPEGVTREEFNGMLQDLLAKRFKLAVHHESKEMPRYELVVAKGGRKLKAAVEPPEPKPNGAAAAPAAPAARREPLHLGKDGYPVLTGGRGGMAIMNGRARMYNPAETMAALASMLGAQLGAPVADATGLSGKYEVDLYWDFDSMRPAAGGREGDAATEPGPSLVQAVQQQLGLRLEAKKGPLDILVVDHAEKTPTEN